MVIIILNLQDQFHHRFMHNLISGTSKWNSLKVPTSPFFQTVYDLRKINSGERNAHTHVQTIARQRFGRAWLNTAGNKTERQSVLPE
jgi:hypothetical protein